MNLNDLSTILIQSGTANPASANFGTPLVAAYMSPSEAYYPTTRVTSFSSVAAMTSAGIPVTEPAYAAIAEAFAQTPAPSEVKLGLRLSAYTQTFTITVLLASQYALYNFAIGPVGVSPTAVSYTVGASATTSTVATALAAAITALGLASVSSCSATGAVITVTSHAGMQTDFFPDIRTHMTIAETTTDPGITTDLNGIYAADPNWYGLALDNNSKAEALAAAAWQESRGFGLFRTQTTDSVCVGGSDTTSLIHAVKAANYTRTTVLFSGAELVSHSGLASLTTDLTQNPGSYAADYQALTGVLPDALTETEYDSIAANNGGTYTETDNEPMTFNILSGSGAYPDYIRFVDWFKNTSQVALFRLNLNNRKIPYTNPGVGLGIAAIKSVITQGQSPAYGGIATSPLPTVTAPDVSTATPANIVARNFAGLAATFTYTNAIKTWDVNVLVVQ